MRKKKELSSHDSFFNKLRNSNLLEKDYADFKNLIENGSSTERALSKLGVKIKLPTFVENYLYLFGFWAKNIRNVFEIF